jgi:hypothetical protein
MAVKNPECTICGETFKDGRGLSGHLQFKHGLSGEEHERELEKGMSRGEKQQSPAPSEVGGRTGRSVRDRELELKGMLWEIEEKREELKNQRPAGDVLGIFGSSKEIDSQLEELDQREGRIRERLQKIDSGSSPEDVGDSELAQAIDTEVNDG